MLLARCWLVGRLWLRDNDSLPRHRHRIHLRAQGGTSGLRPVFVSQIQVDVEVQAGRQQNFQVRQKAVSPMTVRKSIQ
jgi:hypothetical protein